MKKGLVSIIIPTFNRAALLRDTLASVLAQTYDSWECLVIDDGSADDTPAVMQHFTTQDSRIHYHQRPADRVKGANTCRNYGFEISQGEFVNWFDSDDLMYPDFLRRKVAELQADPTLDFCACVAETFQAAHPENRQPMPPSRFTVSNLEADFLLNGFSMYTPAPLWRRQMLADKPLFDTTLSRSQEADFHFRMLSYNPKFHYLPDVLYGVRLGNESISSQAGSSVNAQRSVFIYFERVFQSVLRNNPPDALKLKRYLFYRLAAIYYSFNALSGSPGARMHLYREMFPALRHCAANAQLPWLKRLRLTAGVIVLLLLGKGFFLFHYPEYDSRKTGR